MRCKPDRSKKVTSKDERIARRAYELFKQNGPDPVGSKGWARWARATYEIEAEDRERGIGWREIDRETAWTIWSVEGYDRWTFVLTERESRERTFKNCSGYTHAKDAPNDHYWRLVAVGGRWYFAIVN